MLLYNNQSSIWGRIINEAIVLHPCYCFYGIYDERDHKTIMKVFYFSHSHFILLLQDNKYKIVIIKWCFAYYINLMYGKHFDFIRFELCLMNDKLGKIAVHKNDVGVLLHFLFCE